jgi:hypothetical protein
MTGQRLFQVTCPPLLMTRRSVYLDYEPGSSGRESAPYRTLPSRKKNFGKEKVKFGKVLDALSTTYVNDDWNGQQEGKVLVKFCASAPDKNNSVASCSKEPASFLVVGCPSCGQGFWTGANFKNLNFGAFWCVLVPWQLSSVLLHGPLCFRYLLFSISPRALGAGAKKCKKVKGSAENCKTVPCRLAMKISFSVASGSIR